MSLALLAGLGAAVALAVLMSQIDQSISDTNRLRELGLPVLGGISIVPSSTHRAKSYPQALTVAASILFLLAVYGSLAGRMLMHQKVLF